MKKGIFISAKWVCLLSLPAIAIAANVIADSRNVYTENLDSTKLSTGREHNEI